MNGSKISGVAMFVPSFEPLSMGGSETQTKRLSKELVKNGVDVFIVTPGTMELPREETIEGIKVFRFTKWFRKIIKAALVNKKVVFDYSQKQGYDLLYAEKPGDWRELISMITTFMSAFPVFFKRRRDFQIIQINTVTNFAVIGTLIGRLLRKRVIVKDSTMDGLLRMLMTPFPNAARRFLIRYVSVFVAMTKVIAENYQKVGLPENKIIMIPNGIESIPIPAAVKNFTSNCLFVGNLYHQPAKGIDILLKAWPEVLRAVPDAMLTIVGDGNIPKYQQFVKELDIAASVHFTGKQKPVEYYLSHDLFILPSRREGMSNALMEAMMYGMPVVATDISGSQDLIDGEGGRLVPSNNAAALAEAITELLCQPEQFISMGRYNREKVSRLCSMERVAKSYIECYGKN